MEEFPKAAQWAIQNEESLLISNLLIIKLESPRNIIRHDGHFQRSDSHVVGNMLILNLEDCCHIFG